MAAVRLQFSRQDDPISSLIAWLGCAPFSHTDIILPDGQLLGARSDRVGGKPPGVQIRPPGYVKFAAKVVFTIPCTDAQEGAFLDFAHKQVGKPYDKWAILGFITGRDWRDESAWFCDELVVRCAEVSTIMPYVYMAVWKITPGAAALAVSAIGATWETVI